MAVHGVVAVLVRAAVVVEGVEVAVMVVVVVVVVMVVQQLSKCYWW